MSNTKVGSNEPPLQLVINPCIFINGIINRFFKLGAGLTHWGRVTHICVSKLTIIGSDNGLAPVRRQAIIWTNAGILFIGPLGTKLSENLFEILTFSFTKMRLKVSSAKWRLLCLGLNELINVYNKTGPGDPFR